MWDKMPSCPTASLSKHAENAVNIRLELVSPSFWQIISFHQHFLSLLESVPRAPNRDQAYRYPPRPAPRFPISSTLRIRLSGSVVKFGSMAWTPAGALTEYRGVVPTHGHIRSSRRCPTGGSCPLKGETSVGGG